jgi:3-hydroxybutyryl-CoA dehydrogenase
MTDVAPAAAPDPRPLLPLVGIVGAGIMGAGIAQLALEAGHEVLVHDVDEPALEGARGRIHEGLARRAAKAADAPDVREAWVDERLARLRLTDVLEQLGDGCDLVIEAAIESLELKQTIFRTLDAVADPSTILASNTSALSIAAIASATSQPQRVLGLHFFNPAPLMPLVEVVAGPDTSRAAVATAEALMRSWGRTSVRSSDGPGFIVNRVNRPFTLRALRLVEAGRATVDEIDDALRQAGFPLGPFELMDLTGIDVTFAASTAIWERLGRPERLRPSRLQEERIADGRLGRKTGEGFHRYAAGRRVPPDPGSPPTGRSGTSPDAIRDAILLPIVDEAFRALAEGVGSQADIDIALRLGAAHPLGPFERATELGGPAAVAERLTQLAREDPTFTPSEALVAAARPGR